MSQNGGGKRHFSGSDVAHTYKKMLKKPPLFGENNLSMDSTSSMDDLHSADMNGGGEATRGSDVNIILQPFNYISEIPGKEIRDKLAKAFNYWLEIPAEKLNLISEIVSMLHNASLLVDDIEDSSVLRRGRPVAHSIYGIPSTLNSANYVYFSALSKTIALGHPDAASVFSEQMLQLHIGQGLDIHWRDSYTCPSKERYEEMTKKKTGGLFGFAIRLMQLFSDSSQDFTKLTETLGLYFQIRDDYANLAMKEYTDNKTYCEDLSEGKFSYPVVHAISTKPECEQVINIIRQRPKDVEVKKHCVSLLEKYGSMDFTIEAMKKLDAEARSQIESFGGNPMLLKILDSLKTW